MSFGYFPSVNGKPLYSKSSFVSSSETIAYLKNYAIGETPNISIGVALKEAEVILEQIKMRNFTQVKIGADTELR